MDIIQPVKHALTRTFSVICVLLVIGGIGWAIYAGIIRPTTKPNPTTTQNAQQIENYQYNYSKPETALFIGIDLWGWKIGIHKEKQQQIKQVIQEIKK